MPPFAFSLSSVPLLESVLPFLDILAPIFLPAEVPLAAAGEGGSGV